MKRMMFILPMLLATMVSAQDLQTIAQRDLVGTARYVGMAGAMTAVGGDPSAVVDNPAGIGVFRRLDVSLSLDMNFDRVRWLESKQKAGEYNAFTASQASFIFALPSPSGRWHYNNVMFSYHRLASFNRRYTAFQTAEWSLADLMCLNTDGLPKSAVSSEGRWDNVNVGWLSCQAYDTYLISPTKEDSLVWENPLDDGQTVNNHFTITETGYVNQYALGWGGNFDDRLFLGVTLNMLSLYHNQTVQYYEEFGEGCGLDNNTYFSQSALGFNAAVGVIYHPIKWVRLGASFTTPSAMTLTTTSYGNLSSTLWIPNAETGVKELSTHASATPQNRYTDRSLTMPLRVSVGAAFQCLNYGLLSVQYDYAHNKYINDIHTLRVGVEGVIVNHFFINAGYAFEGTFKKSSPIILDPTTVRTDAYTQTINNSQYITAGFGWRAHHVTVHAAYRLRMQQLDTYAHQLAEPYKLKALTHGLVVTIGFHTR